MKRTVKDVMTEDVVVAQDTFPYKEIVWLLDAKGLSALPVVDENRAVIGVVSEADLLSKEAHEASERTIRRPRSGRHRAEHVKAAASLAGQLMSSPVITTAPDASIAEAARTMARHGVKRLPVTDGDGRLVGIVSRRDLLKVFLRPDEDIRREVLDDVIHRTLSLMPEEADVRADVTDGVVRLEGWLERKSLLDILVGLVLGIEGVVNVDNRLTFKRDDTHIRTTTPPAVGRPTANPPQAIGMMRILAGDRRGGLPR